jgi:DUF1009 family protein
MAGAGVLPGWAAAEAARQGWRVVAFAFGDAPGLVDHAQLVIPARVDDIPAVLAELAAQHASAALFVGKFWKQGLFAHRDREIDDTARGLARGGLSDGALAEMVVATLGGLGIEVLDQRGFLRAGMAPAGALTARAPTSAESTEIHDGFALARRLATSGIGQTIVRSLGVTVAVEAVEGTDETIRRGGRLSGRGAIVVKAAGTLQDYRFDVPTVGPTTIEAMIEGGASALGVEAGKVLLVEREELVRLADAAGIAVAGILEPS